MVLIILLLIVQDLTIQKQIIILFKRLNLIRNLNLNKDWIKEEIHIHFARIIIHLTKIIVLLKKADQITSKIEYFGFRFSII